MTAVALKPQVTVSAAADADKARELIAKGKAHCLISNSVKTQVTVETTIA